MKVTPFLLAATLVCAACDELESADDVREAPRPTPIGNMDASLPRDASASDAGDAAQRDAQTVDAGTSVDAGGT